MHPEAVTVAIVRRTFDELQINDPKRSSNSVHLCFRDLAFHEAALIKGTMKSPAGALLAGK